MTQRAKLKSQKLGKIHKTNRPNADKYKYDENKIIKIDPKIAIFLFPVLI